MKDINFEQRSALLSFKSFTINHPQFDSALNILNNSIQATSLRGEPACALLLGESGTGKTSICNHIIEEFDEPHESHIENEVKIIRPVVYCRIPGEPTLRGLAINLLGCFETYPSRDALASLDIRLNALLKSSETQIIFLDELQHLLQRGAASTKENVCNWIKVLSDTFGGELILAGTPPCKEIITKHLSLSGRYPYICKLYPFTLSSKENQQIFFNVISAFSTEIRKSMPLDEMSPLTNEDILLGLYAATGGNMRGIRTVLYEALIQAFSSTPNELSIRSFAQAADNVYIETRLTALNPFTMTIAQLNHVLFNTNEAK